jgi:hypothetical protein
MGARILQDQHTRGLRNSTELKNVLHLFADAMRGKKGVERTAIGNQLAVDLRRGASSSILLAAQGYTEALDKVDADRSSEGYRNTLAVGDARCCPPGPNTSIGCTADGRRICDYDRIGARSDDVNGQGVITIEPQPSAGFSWWRPRLVRGFAHDVTNPSIPRWEGDFITLIQIGQHPVEGFSAAPSVTEQQGVHFGDFVVPDNSGIPVGWPEFSNEANSNQFIMQGISLWQAGVHQYAYFTIMGNPLDSRTGPAMRCNPESTPPGPVGGATAGNYSNPGQGSRPM